MAQKQRNETNPQYCWDISHIFTDRAAWEAAYSAAKAEVDAIPGLEGRLKTSPEALKDALDKVTRATKNVEIVYLYALLKKAVDQGDPEAQTMEARAMTLYVELSSVSSFIEPELLEISEDTLTKWLLDDAFAVYRHYIANVTRGRGHTLDTARERMLAMLGDAVSTPSGTFNLFEGVDMTFPDIKDENGKDAALTHGSFAVFRESADRRVREEAFLKYFGEFRKYINTLASLYSGSVKFDCYFSDVRGFESACHRALFGNNIPIGVYDALVEAVRGGLGTMRRYMDLRRRVLGLDELHLYDLYVPMVGDAGFEMPYEKGAQLVRNALAPLGEEYAALLDEAFGDKWIDVYENHGKMPGAFCCGVYGVHPYVLLNYTDTLDDAFTLAHELGHAMHSYKSDKTQDFVNHDYTITVAEVASTVNEVLLFKYLLSVETDKKRRAYILNHFLEGFRTTVFRQTLFAEFERRAHDMQKAGEPLTAKTLSSLYRELNDIYYAGAVNDEIMDVEWARIPHFYNAFYVYQYATGFCSAVAIADRILKTGDAGDYLKFLTTGGIDYPLEELKIAGIDLEDPQTVAGALRIFDETVRELETLLIQ